MYSLHPAETVQHALVTPSFVCQMSITEAKSESLAEARSARRRRKLDQIEIPEGHVIVTDELLGAGGFGEVFLADLNGRNAAAKVHKKMDLPHVQGPCVGFVGNIPHDHLRRQSQTPSRRSYRT